MYLLPALLKRQDSGSGSAQGDATGGSNNHGTLASSRTLSVNPTPTASAAAEATSSSTKSSGGSHSTIILVVVLCIVAVLGLLLLLFFLRRTRQKHKNPKYVPTPFLKKLWEKWEPKSNYRLPTRNEHLEPISSRSTNNSRASGQASEPPPSFDTSAGNSADIADNGTATTVAGVDRNTSIRSVMTLPAYHHDPLQNEQVLGREGDRGGIDVVIEFPETVDEEEEHREEEMEALYQVRLARRRENEEREERRRLRREARQRGDFVALREISARQRANSGANVGRTVEELRVEHDRIKKERQRAVSSVQYADLGVARHDGTRLRANSNDSERQGLLGDAASIAASSRHHRRDRSASSILSIDTVNSELPSPGLTRSRANSRPESPGHFERDRAGSSPEMIEHEDIPPNSPPEYENISLETPVDGHSVSLGPPPDYSSPIVGRGEHPMFESNSPLRQTQTSPERQNTNTSPERQNTNTSPERQNINSSPEWTHIPPLDRTTTSPPPHLHEPDYHPSPLRRQASISERREYEPAVDPLHPALPHPHMETHQRSGSSSRESSDHPSGRRASNPHVGQLISERRTSSQSPLSRESGSGSGSGNRGRGVGGVPQLPSLRLGSLPRIEVDPGSPAVGPVKRKTAPTESAAVAMAMQGVGIGFMGGERAELE